MKSHLNDNGNEELVTPADLAIAHFEMYGAEKSDLINEMLKEYQWGYGDYSVKCEFAPENEETRVYYIVTLKDIEFMRCKYKSAVTSIFQIIEESSALRDRCKALEALVASKKGGCLEQP